MDVAAKVYLVFLVLLPETSNGKVYSDICRCVKSWSKYPQERDEDFIRCCERVKSFLDKSSSSECKKKGCIDATYKRLCGEPRNSFWKNVEICCNQNEKKYDNKITKICCFGRDDTDKATKRNCADDNNGRSVTRTTPANDNTTSSTPATDPTTPSTPATDPTTPSTSATDPTTPSTPATDPTEQSALLTSAKVHHAKTEADTTLMSTNGLARKDENLHGSAAGSTDTGTLAGGIVGGLLGGVVITVVVVVVWWSCRRRRKRDQDANFRQTESGQSKKKTPAFNVPDVIKMSSSSLNVDDHECHFISETQSRRPETGDSVDIKEEDLKMGNTDYELAGGLNKIPSNHVETKDQNSTRGETEYKLAGGFQETSNGRLGQNVNNDDYNRLGDGSFDRLTAGTDYDKFGVREYPGQDLAADYFVLEEQVSKLGAAATSVDGQGTYNRLRHAGTDVTVDKQDNKLGDSQSSREGDTTYNRLGQDNQGPTIKSANNAYEEAAGHANSRRGQTGTEDKLGHKTDIYNRLGQESQEQSNKPEDNAFKEVGTETYSRLGHVGTNAREYTQESPGYFVLEEQTK